MFNWDKTKTILLNQWIESEKKNPTKKNTRTELEKSQENLQQQPTRIVRKRRERERQRSKEKKWSD